MAEELMVVLKRSENSGFGFSLLGTTGPPHVIYDIVENSPAAECGAVEAGDIIVKVNGTDVHRYTTKEVLKCLRLSDDLVTLELKRDPKIKARIKEQLASTKNLHYNSDSPRESPNIFDIKTSSRKSDPLTSSIRRPPTQLSPSSSTTKILVESPCRPSRIPTALALKCPAPKNVQHSPQHKRPRPSQIPKANANGGGGNNFQLTNSFYTQQSEPGTNSNSNNFKELGDQQQQIKEPQSAPPTTKARFEAYMMTGDLILNLSRTPQSSNLIPAHAKKVDSLRDSPNRAAARANGALAPRASGESTPSSSSASPSHSESSDSVNLIKKKDKTNNRKDHSINNTYSSNNSSDRQFRKDSLTNDTLLLCEELDRDEEDEEDNNDDDEEDVEEEDEEIDPDEQDKLDEESLDEFNYEISPAPYASDSQRGGGDVQQTQECLGSEFNDDLSAGVTSSSSSFKQKLLQQQQQRNSDRVRIQQTAATATIDLVDSSSARDYTGPSSQYHHHHHHHHHHHAHHRQQHYQQQQQQQIQIQQQNNSSSSSSSTTVKSEANSSPDETSFSVPTSPISLSTPLLDVKETANSVPTSPEPSGINEAAVIRRQHHHNGVVRKCDSAGFRTSKSEDHLQQVQREGIAAVIPIDIDEDVNSSLNTLLDTRQDSEDSQPTQKKKADPTPTVLSHRDIILKRRKKASNRDRIVWTYNAPLPTNQQQQQYPNHHYPQHYATTTSPNSHSSSISSSPQHTDSPASPTSVSSSVMSSSGSKGALGGAAGGGGGGGSSSGMAGNSTGQTNQNLGFLHCPVNGDQSVSEAISNISSPDYQDDDNLLSSRDLIGGMVLSDPSDSDSTILVSEAVQRKRDQQKLQQQQQQQLQQQQQQQQNEHKLVIQVRGLDSSNSTTSRSAYSELKDSEDELATLTEEPPTVVTANNSNSSNGNGNQQHQLQQQDSKESSPPVSDDGSDVESLHSYHYSPKAVDMPSAIRLAKRLYSLDGFKKSDVSRHLSKNNDFSRAVADEYLKYFTFEKKTLDQALREFLQQFSLSGETQERERVLVHFSKRFLDCNAGTFNSQDAVHTLTCAIMLLNTDLHGANISRKMTCAEFVDNLAELNDGENFPKDVLKYLYQAIKSQPLEWALDDESPDQQKQRNDNNMGAGQIGQNPFLDIPEPSAAIEYKKGYVMRKCCYESNYKKTPFGKRSWKMFYCTLRDLVLYLHKDEHGFRKSQMSDNLHNAIRIHHALATKATDYTKKQHVFRLQTADQAEYLFQTSDSKELQSWVETINFVCASFSAPPLEGGVGSQKRFQRPLLPSTHTKLLMKEQLTSHEHQVIQLENTVAEHKKGPIPSKGLPLQNYKEKENYLQYELRRYKTYVSILNAKLLADQQMELQNNCLINPDDPEGIFGGGGAGNGSRTIITGIGNPTQPSNSIILQSPGQQQQQSQQSQQQQTTTANRWFCACCEEYN
ncbi:PH and SEC7 domain-containing protein isoform X2 [Episyrphus balteatus]|uniref:PH and SEC7 domain-containing protein isoform X2 n=1 Tax=Episyrphus balteatus TaxID=286459 RepID=UPI0024861BA1|nr:PH and SEC7 domain-containing protein isoform X2 [Episyrphus balteatus]XP_055851060.1 PH and SEC7 domain-containing protein isoform X2 [Episyrphus balteatus]XP_055851061.1 PH and SEC7 domain-containing protein isoform X2 [Episyrphus balteatus]